LHADEYRLDFLGVSQLLSCKHANRPESLIRKRVDVITIEKFLWPHHLL